MFLIFLVNSAFHLLRCFSAFFLVFVICGGDMVATIEARGNALYGICRARQQEFLQLEALEPRHKPYIAYDAKLKGFGVGSCRAGRRAGSSNIGLAPAVAPSQREG